MNVKISELKARLSAYLDVVRRGKTVTVLDRKTPVARLVPISEDGDGLRLVPAARPPGDADSIRGVRPKRRMDVDALLAKSRSER